MTTFTEEDYKKLESKANKILGWDFKNKFGMSLREMIENPEKGKQLLIAARYKSGFVDRLKIEKILNYLEEPDWEKILKSKLS